MTVRLTGVALGRVVRPKARPDSRGRGSLPPHPGVPVVPVCPPAVSRVTNGSPTR